MISIYCFKFWSMLPESERPSDPNGVKIPAGCIHSQLFFTENIHTDENGNEVPGPMEAQALEDGFTIVKGIETGEALIVERKALFDAWFAAFPPPPPPSVSDQVNSLIEAASKYGIQLMKDFGKRNVMLGKTAEEIDSIMENPEMAKIAVAMQAGSLQYAQRKITALELFLGVTQEDKDWLITKLNLFLNP